MELLLYKQGSVEETGQHRQYNYPQTELKFPSSPFSRVAMEKLAKWRGSNPIC